MPLRKSFLIGLLALAGATAGWFTARGTHGASSAALANVQVNTVALPRDADLTSYASVVKVVAPSVVSVFSTTLVKGSNADSLPFSDDPILRHFFGSETPARPRKELSLGSGVIVSADGYILTNNHVIEGAEEIRVALRDGDGREFTAQVVGRDSVTDLAVLKIAAQQLPVMTFGNSDQLEVGDVVLAVGNPFDLGQTVTMGIVSGLKRQGLGIEGYENFIQTDASINPGNSGGPLVDVAGRLIGINTAILSGSGGNQGIGFAIPGNLARRVMEQLIRTGQVVRGFLGVAVQSLSPDLAQALNIPPHTAGALVSEVIPHSPASQAGLKPGDVVVAFNGHPVKDSSSLQRLVADTPPHSHVDLRVLRGDKAETVAATLQQMPAPKLVPASTQPLPPQKQGLSGLSLKDLDRMLRQHLSVPESVHGPVVVKVDPNSAAYDAGLRPGDVIEEIQRHPVANATQAQQAANQLHQQPALVLVWNQDGTHYVAVTGD